MLATSGSYNSLNVSLELIIREAFERIGIMGDIVVPQQLDAATRSINFLLAEWSAKSINLWTLQSAFLPLKTACGTYVLYPQINNITQANLRTSTRQLGGVANASNAPDDASNVFGNDPVKFCDAGNSGWISYDYGEGNKRAITFIGILSDVDNVYDLVFEYSLDDINWISLYKMPVDTQYTKGEIKYYDIPSPVEARVYRIKNNAETALIINKLYFNNNVQDLVLSEVSRSEFLSYPQPTLLGRPSVYYVDRQITPILNIWPTPSLGYDVLYYSFTEMIQDAGSLSKNTLQIPARFYHALVWGLSYLLAIKYTPDKSALFKSEYAEAFNIASQQDSEDVPLRIYGDYSNYGIY